MPLLLDPTKTVKPAALTQHPRPAYYDRTEKGVPDAMGYSIRTDKVRYTEWRNWTSGKVLAAELYDHVRDTAEARNLIESPPAELAGPSGPVAARGPGHASGLRNRDVWDSRERKRHLVSVKLAGSRLTAVGCTEIISLS